MPHDYRSTTPTMTTTFAGPVPPVDVALRTARPDDVETVAVLWHEGWRDGHLGHVPDELLPHRRLPDFRRRVPGLLEVTTVAATSSNVIGFVTVVDDEIEQIYVARSARGTSVAATLLEHGERCIARRHVLAWLAVVAGNYRARRFYERNGWHDAGAIDYPAAIAGGTLIVPCRHYEKPLRPP